MNTWSMPVMKSCTGLSSFFWMRSAIHSTSMPWEKFFSSLEVMMRALTDLSAMISSSIAFMVSANSRFCLFAPLHMVRIATVSSLAHVMIAIKTSSAVFF